MNSSALIVVDVQNGFVEHGSLPVPNGKEVIPVINRIAKAFQNIVITQDWHVEGHSSFASSHPNKKPFDVIEQSYGEQVLWPDHCIQGTNDASLCADLVLPSAQLIIRKGYHKDIDSYSAFIEADRRTTTGLAAYLSAREIDTVYIAGLATDFCVAWTAIDAISLGFAAYVVEDASRAININGSLDAAWKKMTDIGVKRVHSSYLMAS